MMQMPDPKVFFDTNILLYLLSGDTGKADRAEAIMQIGGLISVQVLNEVTTVGRRKLSMSWSELDEFLSLIQSVLTVESLTLDTYNRGRYVAEQYGLSVYDSMIVATALIGECSILYSEDMYNGLLVDDQLHICNPFVS
jgi:predicted nucleic acid-binding protein